MERKEADSIDMTFFEEFVNKTWQYRQLGWDLKQMQPNVVELLVRFKMCDCLTVNVAKLSKRVKK